MQVTVVVPTGKNDPVAGEHVMCANAADGRRRIVDDRATLVRIVREGNVGRACDRFAIRTAAVRAGRCYRVNPPARPLTLLSVPRRNLRTTFRRWPRQGG